ncbi:MAG: 50S ribosomal protein L13 [Patescibacteria group bacterium]|jgi:large subunit ribosomal protein L13
MAQQELITIDAAKRSFGRVATEVAHHLRGKHLTSFSPNTNPRVKVEVVNLDQIRFTGKKMEQKIYTRYSGYPGGLKKTQLKDRWAKNPERVLRDAVRKMLPVNRLRAELIKNLIVK